MQLSPIYRRYITYTVAAALLAGGLLYAAQPLENSKALQDGDKPLSSIVAKKNGYKVAATGAARTASSMQARPKVQTYTVVSGDTIEAITNRFGLSLNSVLWANDMGADDILQIGAELLIPGMDGLLRKVRNGDTLWDFAADFGGDIDAIVQANPDIEPGALRPGQIVLIPGGKPEARRQVASRSAPVRSSNARSFDVWPAAGNISDPFGWRIHPVYGTRHFHDGLDIDVGSGTPLRSVGEGTVTMATRYGGYGLAVRIDHGRGVVTQYSHMSKIEVTVGQKVTAGQHIGYSGNTGVTTGPHLHFSVLVNGSPVDPQDWLP